jgi:CIC family chloride channel protein
VFLLTAISGFAYEGFIGTGHHLIENIIHGSSVWYLVIIVFCVRMLLLMLANTSGISGGLFIPRLALGALLGALLGNMFISLAWIDEKYFAVIIIISMTSFLASEARMPITAFVFSIEALSGIYNMLPILLGVTTSYFIIKLAKTPSFSDIIIEKNAKEAESLKLNS